MFFFFQLFSRNLFINEEKEAVVELHNLGTVSIFFNL